MLSLIVVYKLVISFKSFKTKTVASLTYVTKAFKAPFTTHTYRTHLFTYDHTRHPHIDTRHAIGPLSLSHRAYIVEIPNEMLWLAIQNLTFILIG